jgi:hypothetical protein
MLEAARRLHEPNASRDDREVRRALGEAVFWLTAVDDHLKKDLKHTSHYDGPPVPRRSKAFGLPVIDSRTAALA